MRPARIDSVLPALCTTPCVLRVLLLCEAVAVGLALAAFHDAADFLRRLLFLSLYLQWIGICSAAALCLLRRHAAGRLSATTTLVLAYAAVLLVTFSVAEVTYVAGRHAGLAPLPGRIEHGVFIVRSMAICALVAALALHYFRLQAAWRAGIKAEAAVRLQALQARIEPHFLFNSLNSIASLIASRPQAAEKATEDLATLLRARLRNAAPDMVTLADELALVAAYLRIEQLRLGQRLRQDWRIEPQSRACLVPALLLQPLIENAIAHGIAHCAEGGLLTLRAQRDGQRLWIRISNPLIGHASASRPGNRQALRNIEQRLRLRYAHRQ